MPFWHMVLQFHEVSWVDGAVVMTLSWYPILYLLVFYETQKLTATTCIITGFKNLRFVTLKCDTNPGQLALNAPAV